MPLDDRRGGITAFRKEFFMKRFNLLPATCLATLLLLTVSASAQTVFSIDDGVGESSLGTSSGNTIAYLNSFTGVAGTTQIGSIQIVFGTPALSGLSAGLPLSAFLWSDPNGDGSPTDATVLGSISGTMATPHSSLFETFTFAAPVTLTTDNFFVGYIFNNTTGTTQHPGAMDKSNVLANRSFVALSSASLDPNNLGAVSGLSVTTTESVGLSGNFLIRATAIPEPSTYAACFGAASLGLVLLCRRGKRR